MDDLSPRERRAQRARQAGSKRKTGAINWSAWKVPLVILVVIGLGAMAIVALKSVRPECPDHWHGTFRIYTPNEDGTPRMVDMNLPKDSFGRPYYDLGTGKMRPAIHMHQSGPEQGSEALGPTQLHYEGGVCVGLRSALDVADVALREDGLTIAGEHAAVGQAGEWSNNGNQTLRFWLQTIDGTWSEHPMGDYIDYQLKDGEAVLIAFGNYTDEQVQQMQGTVPVPMSRPAA